MTTHSKLSPSARHRWAACPASIRATANIPPEPSGAAAIDGTHSHTLLEKCIDMMMMPASMFIGHTLTDHEGSFVVDRERADRVQMALDHIAMTLVEHPGAKVYSEVRVDPGPYTSRDDMAGTVDIHIVWRNPDGTYGLELADYKDGVQRVEVERNPQLEQYGMGLLAKYGSLPIKTLTMTIIQPKLITMGISAINQWTVTIDEFFDPTLRALIDQAAATDDPNAPFVSGDHCKWCPNKGCSAKASQTLAKAGISFGAIDLATQAANVPVDTLSDDRLREIMEAAPLIRAMLDAVDEHVLERFKSSRPVAGLKMITTPGKRKWAFSDEEIISKLTKMGVPKQSLMKESLISFTAIEKGLTWSKRDGTQTSLSKDQVERVMTEFVIKGEGSPKVVPDGSLAQKDFANSVAQMFKAV